MRARFWLLLLLSLCTLVRSHAQAQNMILQGVISNDPATDIITKPFEVDVFADLPRNSEVYNKVNAVVVKALPGLNVAVQQGKPVAILNYAVLQYNGWHVPEDKIAALKAFDQAAQMGVAEAMVWQGDLQRNKDGSQFDGAAARPYYEAAAAKGSNTAKHRLFGLYAYGNGVASDVSKAKAYLTELVAAKIAYAQYSQALLHQNGTLNTAPDMSKARELMQAAADQTYGPAQLWMGAFHLDNKNYPYAIQYFEKAWEQGYTDAAVYIGRMVRDGQSVAADDKQAVAWYQRAADAGNGWGMSMLSRAYRRGDGVKQDYMQAKAWGEKGAELGNAISEVQLSIIYQQGLGVPRDEKYAFDLTVRAANKGQPDAICNLGIYYEFGNIVSRDRARARQLRAQGASNGGFVECVSHTAFLFSSLTNDGITDPAQQLAPDPVQFKYFAEKAAALGDAKAKIMLARCMTYGTDKCKKDGAAALKVWQDPDLKDDAEALTAVAQIYMNGNGVPQDIPLALRLFNSSKVQNYGFALYLQGIIYSDGTGGQKVDYARAKKLFEKAVSLGNVDALTALGRIYWYGKGVAVDKPKALAYWRQAAEAGVSEALTLLGRILREEPALAKSKDEGLNAFKRAAALGNRDGTYELGYDAVFGKSGPPNASEAFRYFSVAAEQGEATAQNALGMFYWTGRGIGNDAVVPIDYVKARAWFERAVRQGQPHALISLATMEASGIGGAKDVVSAYAHICLASISNYVPGLEPERLEKALWQCRAIGERLTPDMLARGKAMIAAFKPVLE